MKRLFYILLFLILLVPRVRGATLIFSTGFESAVAVDAPGATNQYFTDCGGANTGCADASTGYNVPYDMPGYCQGETCTEGSGTPSFNFVYAGDDEATIDATYFVGGTKSLATYYEGDGTSRCQLVLDGDTGAALNSGNNFSRTLSHLYVYFPALPDAIGEWILWNEWYSTEDTHPGRFMWHNSGGTEYLEYYGGDGEVTSWPCGANDSCATGTVWGYRSEVEFDDYTGKWLEVIIFMEEGATGHVIAKIKPRGGSEATLINFEGDNNRTWIGNYSPIKGYGTQGNQKIYWDNFRMYSSTGYTDLCPWDETPPDSGSLSHTLTRAIADISHFRVRAYADVSHLRVRGLVESGETPQELGYFATSGGTPTHTTTSRCSRHTTIGAMTVTHGYVYTQDYQQNNSDTVTLAVFGSDGGSPSQPNAADQKGDCSSTATITNDDMHWEEVTFSGTQPSLSAATEYFVCQFINGDIGTYYVTGSANDEYYETDTTCPGDIDGTGSTRNTTMTVSNYDAH